VDVSVNTLCSAMSDHTDKAKIICLMIKRDGLLTMTPAKDSLIEIGDTLLFSGTSTAASKQARVYHNIELFDNYLNPSLSQIPLLRWISTKQLNKLYDN